MSFGDYKINKCLQMCGADLAVWFTGGTVSESRRNQNQMKMPALMNFHLLHLTEGWNEPRSERVPGSLHSSPGPPAESVQANAQTSAN